jgi:hypothetical protein
MTATLCSHCGSRPAVCISLCARCGQRQAQAERDSRHRAERREYAATRYEARQRRHAPVNAEPEDAA